MAKRPELLITSGPLAGRHFQVSAAGLRLGRSSSNDVSIADEELSRNHCLFEPVGEAGLRLIDLASANGTFVNGEQLSDAPRVLAVGDRLEVGTTRISVVNPDAPVPPPPPAPDRIPAAKRGGVVDLGLSRPPTAAMPASERQPSARKPLANLLWMLAALVFVAAIAVILLLPRESEKAAPVTVIAKQTPALIALAYEKVEADASRIFRYELTIDEAGVLRVVSDDVPGENRHVDKKVTLSATARKRVLEILQTPGFAELDREYTGSSAANENALRSTRIRVVQFNQVKDVCVENAPEPDAFRTVADALEAFSRNELGIWAIQYSRDKLLEMSAASAELGDAKWEEREVEYGNLSAALRAYREAIFYLDTVNPKPESYDAIKKKMSVAEAELQQRYNEQRFLADRAMNLGDWETAQIELKVLCDLVPDKEDPRYTEANAKLVDVENRMKKAKGGRGK